MTRRPPISPLFPYTTLFRSVVTAPPTLLKLAVPPLMVSAPALVNEIGRAHVCTPVTLQPRMLSSACKNEKPQIENTFPAPVEPPLSAHVRLPSLNNLPLPPS